MDKEEKDDQTMHQQMMELEQEQGQIVEKEEPEVETAILQGSQNPTPSTEATLGSSFSESDALSTSIASPRAGINTSSPVSDDGFLDLSGQQLTALNRAFKNEYREVVKFDLHNNSLKTFSGADAFKSLKELDLSSNKLVKLSSLVSLGDHLQRLTVDSNRLVDVKILPKFKALQHISIKDNEIESIPNLVLPSLRYMDLSSNRLNTLPNVAGCAALQYLGLANNQISQLQDINQHLPKCLKSLSLNGNQINDLTQLINLHGLNLVEIAVADNACFIGSPIFNERPFMACLLKESIQVVDGEPLNEEEQLKGELLLIKGKVLKFRADQHTELYSYLAENCPIDRSTRLSDSFNLTVQKALHARTEGVRRHHSRSAMDISDAELDDTSSKFSENVSVYSPFSKWNSQLPVEHRVNTASTIMTTDKENERPQQRSRCNSFNSGECLSPRRSLSPSPRSPFKSSPANRHTLLTRTSTMDSGKSDASSATIVLSTIDDTIRSSTRTTSHTTASSVDLLPGTVQDDGDFGDDTALEVVRPTPSRNQAAVVREVLPLEGRRTISEEKSLKEEVKMLRHEVSSLRMQQEADRKILAELKAEHANQARINELTASTLADLVQKTCLLEEQSTSRPLVPTPIWLKARRVEDRLGRVEICWSLPVVAGYDVYVDGHAIGRVVAPNQKSVVEDLAPGQHAIQLQPISLDGVPGQLSESIIVEIPNINTSKSSD